MISDGGLEIGAVMVALRAASIGLGARGVDRAGVDRVVAVVGAVRHLVHGWPWRVVRD